MTSADTEALRLADDLLTLRDIAKEFGFTYNTIRIYFARPGAPKPRSVAADGRTKLYARDDIERWHRIKRATEAPFLAAHVKRLVQEKEAIVESQDRRAETIAMCEQLTAENARLRKALGEIEELVDGLPSNKLKDQIKAALSAGKGEG